MAAKHKKKRKKSDRRAGAIIFSCVAVLIIAVVLVMACMYMINENNGTIAEGITVAGVDVGGMTQAQARQAVSAVADSYTQKPMTVTVLESQIQISPQTSGAKLNVRSAVKAAFKHGKAGSALDISKYLSLDTKAIREALNELGMLYSSTLSQSTYEVTGTAPDQKLVVNLGVPEYGLDMQLLYRQVLDAYSANVFSVTGECGMIEPTEIDLASIHAQYYVAPIDAYYDKETFQIVEGVNGYGFDLESARNKLAQSPYGTTVEIPFTDIEPQVTSKTLSQSLYLDTLATFTATSDSESNRDTNLRLACEAINGLVIYPGQTFSYNDALGERTAARGYKPGPSYYDGKTVDTIGGGICQVSSCLYYCALLSDLEITTRKNHGYTVTYMPLGMDAAVSWGSLDFKFKNTTDYPIRIDAVAEGGSTTVTLMGTDEKDYYVQMEYEVLATYAYNTTYQTYPADNPEGYKDGDYITEPHTGYKIQTYRCKYNKETKELISREEEAASYYYKCDAVICVIEGNGPSQGIGNGGVTEAE